LANALKLRIVAEGVETQGQLDALYAQGCTLMQGFLFSRPLTADAFERLAALTGGPDLPWRAYLPQVPLLARVAIADAGVDAGKFPAAWEP
jgi:predicted signal transduction protein with EAL and GGDEF domain